MRYYNDELYHHGVKGMKWGVRRYQNKDGSRTTAGKKHDKFLTSIRDGSFKQGLTDKQKKILKGVLVASAAVAVVGAGAYAYRKYSADKVIPATKHWQRVMAMRSDDAVREGAIYASFNKVDNFKYRGLYAGGQLRAQKLDDQNIYKYDLTFNKDIKVASRKHAQDAFERLYNSDAQFKKDVDAAIKNTVDNTPFIDILALTDKSARLYKSVGSGYTSKSEALNRIKLRSKGYDAFNILLTSKSSEMTRAKDRFYKELSSKGYNAIQDVNDSKYSGYNAKSAHIVFDVGYDWTRKQLSDNRMDVEFGAAMGLMSAEGIGKAAASTALVAGGVISVDKMAEKRLKNETDKSVKTGSKTKKG